LLKQRDPKSEAPTIRVTRKGCFIEPVGDGWCPGNVKIDFCLYWILIDWNSRFSKLKLLTVAQLIHIAGGKIGYFPERCIVLNELFGLISRSCLFKDGRINTIAAIKFVVARSNEESLMKTVGVLRLKAAVIDAIKSKVNKS